VSAEPRRASRLLELCCCTASMTTGLLLGEPADPELRERLEHLAATLPELYGTIDPSCLDRITERTGNRGTASGFNELLLLSEDYVHLIQPLANRPGLALVAVGSALGSIGLIVSEFHASVVVAESA
jgi:hypothetical protein